MHAQRSNPPQTAPLLYGAPNPAVRLVIMALECYSTLAKLFAEKTTEIMAHDNTEQSPYSTSIGGLSISESRSAFYEMFAKCFYILQLIECVVFRQSARPGMAFSG